MTSGFKENYSIENPFNLHYINNELNEYNNISQFVTANKVSEDATVRTAINAGNKDENSLTNIIFFQRHPTLNKNERLKPHQKELIEEWLRIRNNIVRPLIAELKNKAKESTKYSGPTLNKLLGPLPEPMKLPPENPVEFAPEPVGTAYWPVRPLRTEDKDWHVVSYRFGPGKNDFVRGRNTAREFYAFRGVDRLHAAIDLYGNAGDQVVAIQDGIFLYTIVNFLGNTSAMYIQHTIDQPNLIFVYGEVAKYSWTTFNLKIGDKVKAGQVIAKLGITPGGSSMLHCETWGLGVTGIKNRLHSSFRSWKKGGQPPKYVLNPTKYLLAVRKQELERRRKQQQSSSPDNLIKFQFNESLVSDYSESFIGSILPDASRYLAMGKEYATVFFAYLGGETDVNSLTNKIFFGRYPDRKNEPIKRNETEKAKEWIKIRDEIVIKTIAQIKKTQSTSATTPSSQTTTSGTQSGGISWRPDSNAVGRINSFDPIIKKEAAVANINPNLVKGIIYSESSGIPSIGQGTAGYKGLMQASKDVEHLKPEVSIRGGIEHYNDYKNKMFQVYINNGLNPGLLNENEVINIVMRAFNAGPGTVKKAMEYAKNSGNVNNWMKEEYYKRAIFFTGAHNYNHAILYRLKNKTTQKMIEEIAKLTKTNNEYIVRAYGLEKAKNINQNQFYELIKNSIIRTLREIYYRASPKDYPTAKITYDRLLELAENDIGYKLILCSVEYKYNNTQPYVDRIIFAKEYFDKISQ